MLVAASVWAIAPLAGVAWEEKSSKTSLPDIRHGGKLWAIKQYMNDETFGVGTARNRLRCTCPDLRNSPSKAAVLL